jgi:hypothetical protein
MDFTLEDLERQSQEKREQYNKSIRETYQLARKLGFTPAEAKVLQGKSRDTTIKLAVERGFIKDENDPMIQG